MHIPVLLKETIEILNPRPGKFFIDGTLGSAGHAIEILKRISPNGIFLGIDWDKQAIENFKSNLEFKTCKLKVIELIHENYANLPKILKSSKNEKFKNSKADGLFLDLGMSSDQLENSKRGFSFLKNEILDMRYDKEVQNSKLKIKNLTAAEVVNSFREEALADIFYKYGEERFSRQIAKKIVEERKIGKILTTFNLVNVIKKAVPFYHSQKSTVKNRTIHPATRIFQALRIYVNDELGNLEKLLKNLDKILKSKGRAAIISFHSLEDRLVKNYFREMVKQGKGEILTKKPIRPTIQEVQNNSHSRSAKMRAISFI